MQGINRICKIRIFSRSNAVRYRRLDLQGNVLIEANGQRMFALLKPRIHEAGTKL